MGRGKLTVFRRSASCVKGAGALGKLPWRGCGCQQSGPLSRAMRRSNGVAWGLVLSFSIAAGCGKEPSAPPPAAPPAPAAPAPVTPPSAGNGAAAGDGGASDAGPNNSKLAAAPPDG